jgi:hypothetical protein
MEKFTRFENQFIMMLALRAKQEFQEMVEEQDVLAQIDPHIPKYIESLHSIAVKARTNLREYDAEKESVEPIDVKENPSGYSGFSEGEE